MVGLQNFKPKLMILAMKHSAEKKICVFNIIVMANRALERGLRNNENVFRQLKLEMTVNKWTPASSLKLC